MTTTNAPQQALPVSVQLLQCLEQFSQHTQAIFDDLSKSNAQQQQHQPSTSTGNQQRTDSQVPYARALSSLTELSSIDEKLAELLNKAQVHAKNQKRIEELESKLVQHEIEWRREVNQLESDRKKLKRLLDRGKKDKESIQQAKKAALKPSTILSYARLLAPYTSAPPRNKASMLRLPGITQPAPPTGPGGVPQGSILPYPTEEVMRRGILAFAEVSNIGETTEMTGVRPASPSQLLSKAKETQPTGQKPVPAPAPIPRRAYPQPLEEEEEDIMLDLDLNPGERLFSR
ncbi:hypothetical protein P389DRAFT_195388 [Cystobasidium minutum MCA 4210]|uniref:uncharacterized protein n=1 Tax=Cystobasidium minutum MCA 4210 TaxID=1397322 RepID=UPI0034CED05E|eukprot:jgi/Rhomi1/195388/gm1.3602_g